VSALALNPKRGGPKNLRIAQMYIDDEEDDQIKALHDKPKLVILGGGWGVSRIIYKHTVCACLYNTL
jgi:NADH dehydrogenase